MMCETNVETSLVDGGVKDRNYVTAWSFSLTIFKFTDTDIANVEGFDQYVFQTEKCPETGNLHLQCGIKNDKKKITTNMLDKLFPKTNSLGEKRSVQWSTARKWMALKNYCSKKETRVDGPSGKKFNVRKVRNDKKLKELPPLEDLYDETLATDWQKEIAELIKTKPDDRTVNWYYSKEGKIGKTRFCRHNLILDDHAILVGGKANDIKSAITSMVNKDRKFPSTVFINVPKTMEKYFSYQAVEEIKDGQFFNGKYESQMVLFNPPHVVIFANFLPDLDSISKDRWNIHNISNGKNIKVEVDSIDGLCHTEDIELEEYMLR